MLQALTSFATEHDWRLVALASSVGIAAAFTAVFLACRARATRGRACAGWIAGACIAAACGLWATYRIALLAYEPTDSSDTLLALTIASVTLAVLAVGIISAGMDRRLTRQNVLLDTALNNMNHGLMMFDAASRVILCNQRYIDLYRIPRGAVRPGMSLRDVVDVRIAAGTFNDDPERYCAAVLAGVARRETSKKIVEMDDGRIIAVVGEPLADGGWVATHQDITEERRREASFRFLFDNNPVPMWVWEHETYRFLAVNNATVAKYGYTREHFLTLTLHDIKRSPNWESIQAVVRGDDSMLRAGYVSQHATADGRLLYAAIYGRSLIYEGRPASLVATIDITERKHAEDELRRTREFLDTVIENVPMTIVVKNAKDLTYALANRAAEAQFGHKRGDIVGKTAHELFSAKSADIIEARDRETLNTRRELVSETQPITTPAKGDRYHTSRRLPILDENGEPRYLLSVIEDVTERKRQEDELRRTRKFLDNIIENMPAMLAVKDTKELRYALVNRAAESFFGLTSEEMIGKCAEELFPRQAAETVTMLDRQAIESGGVCMVNEHAVETPHNGTRLVTTKKLVVRDEDGNAEYLLSLSEDVTERKRAEDRIAHMAGHDPLTDLPNRTTFNQNLATAIAHASVSGDGFAILCVNLDRFKEVNDVFGHAAGDTALCEVARRLNAAANGAFIARLGGDEFALVLTEGTQPCAAEALADALLDAAARDIQIGDEQVRIGLSVGVAVYPSDGQDADTLLANADAALSRAKAEGRGSIRFFEAVMDERLRDRRALQHELRAAIEHGELILHYQPQARISGEIVGFEALVRWHHPTRGIIHPGTFIPLAEESGLIVSMSEWILREACREAASWPRPLQIAVNLSPIQFRHGDLPSLVHTILLETGLAPRRLELEVTEGALIDDFSRALSILLRLKTLGVRIAMDDFGTGYSSLSYLQAFPFDKIKIDRTFIANLADNRHSAAIVRAVIGLGRGMHLPVVAEGVENAEQLAFLARESCDEVQGFHIGRPAPIDHYAAIVGRGAVAKLKLVSG